MATLPPAPSPGVKAVSVGGLLGLHPTPLPAPHPALTCRGGIHIPGRHLLHLRPPAQLQPAREALSGLPEVLDEQRLLVVTQHPEPLGVPLLLGALEAADDVAERVLRGAELAQAVALQGLLHQLPRPGAARHQHALVVGARTDVAPEDFEDARGRELGGELGRVVLGGRWGGRAAVLVAEGAVQHLGEEAALALQAALGRRSHGGGRPVKHGA